MDKVSEDKPHRSLPLVSVERRMKERWIVVLLAVAAAALYAFSLTVPWWHFTLFAPQYPKGLNLVISLTGISGDVHEVNMLNHYIGMGHIDDAAIFERQMAAYGVGALGVGAILVALAVGRKLSPLMVLLGLSFPVGFLADSVYWLYRFGHDLDPKAPLRMKVFTPQMFGEGVIGQFRTVATPELGFFLALAGVVCLGVALVLRRRICGSCGRAPQCRAVCTSLLVGPRAGLPKAAP